jgi:hypothetical protein
VTSQAITLRSYFKDDLSGTFVTVDPDEGDYWECAVIRVFVEWALSCHEQLPDASG